MRKHRLFGTLAAAALTVGTTCAVIAPPASAAAPGAPTLVSSSGNGFSGCSTSPQIYIDWTAPASDGGKPIDKYNYTIASGATTVSSGSVEDYYSSYTWNVPSAGNYTVTITAHNADGDSAPLTVPVAVNARTVDTVAPTLGAMSFGATTVIVSGTTQTPVTLDIAASDNRSVTPYYGSELWGPGVTYDAVTDSITEPDDELQHRANAWFGYRKSGSRANGVTQQTFVFDAENKPANGQWSLAEVTLTDQTKVGDSWCNDQYYNFTRRTGAIAANPTYNKPLPSTPSFYLTDVNLPGIGAPGIKGKAKIGKKLTAVTQPPAGVTVAYQWYLTKGSGKKAKTKLIGTGPTLKLKKKVKGGKVSVTATYTAPGGASYLIAGKGKKVK